MAGKEDFPAETVTGEGESLIVSQGNSSDSVSGEEEEEQTNKLTRSAVMGLLMQGAKSNESIKPPEGFQALDYDLFDNLYVNSREIERGGFGVVFHCRHRVDGIEYAVKAIPCTMVDLRDTLSECYILARINHPNVVCYYNSWLQVGLHLSLSERFASIHILSSL